MPLPIENKQVVVDLIMAVRDIIREEDDAKAKAKAEAFVDNIEKLNE